MRLTRLLVLLIVLALLLSACNIKNKPTAEDFTTHNATYPVTTQDSEDSATPDPTQDGEGTATSEPKPIVKDETTPSTNKEPVILLPDPSSLDNEYEAALLASIAEKSESIGIDIDDAIDEAYNKYGHYLNENISNNCVRLAIITYNSWNDISRSNLGGLTPEAIQKVNDFLEANGEEPLNPTDPKQNIAALWLAASLYYDPSSLYYDISLYYDYGYEPYLFVLDEFSHLRFDIGVAFALAKYSGAEDIKDCRDIYVSHYGNLFNLREY